MKEWLKILLKAAGIYNILWGAWVICMPAHFFTLIQQPVPDYLFIWQALGMVVGVYGLGYYIASYDPVRDRTLILVGFLGKLFGPPGAIFYILKGDIPLAFLWLNVFNDFIWLIPFGMILWEAYGLKSKKL